MNVPSGSGLTPLEIACGLVFGVEPGDVEAAPAPPLATLTEAVLRALNRPPCLVSFSGGRDSSCVLALAVDVARREGLPLPVPATLRFPALPEADETAWQERVVSSLGLEDWLRIEPREELDAVGPVATKVLDRFGLLWPFNAYVHQPLLEAAHGGSLLTGVGGDEVLEHLSVDRVDRLLARRVRPVPKDALRLGLAAAPARVRRAVLRRRAPLRLPWLTLAAVREVNELWAEDEARRPRRLRGRARWWTRRRALRVVIRSLGVLAQNEDVAIEHPLTEPAVASAILADPELAFADRARRLETILGDLLPAELYRRRTKASFNRALFGSHARELVALWDGDGADPRIVDREALRAEWLEDVPDGRSYLLLQSVWLERARRSSPAGPPSPPRATTSSEDAGARTTAGPPA